MFSNKCIHELSIPYADEETAAKAAWEICPGEGNHRPRRRHHTCTFSGCKDAKFQLDNESIVVGLETRYISKHNYKDEMEPTIMEKFNRFKFYQSFYSLNILIWMHSMIFTCKVYFTISLHWKSEPFNFLWIHYSICLHRLVCHRNDDIHK